MEGMRYIVNANYIIGEGEPVKFFDNIRFGS